MRQGKSVFSPIAHGHSIAQVGEIPSGFDFWEKNCIDMIKYCSEVVVVKMQGYNESYGVIQEIGIAKGMKKEVSFVEPVFDVVVCEDCKGMGAEMFDGSKVETCEACEGKGYFE